MFAFLNYLFRILSRHRTLGFVADRCELCNEIEYHLVSSTTPLLSVLTMMEEIATRSRWRKRCGECRHQSDADMVRYNAILPEPSIDLTELSKITTHRLHPDLYPLDDVNRRESFRELALDLEHHPMRYGLFTMNPVWAAVLFGSPLGVIIIGLSLTVGVSSQGSLVFVLQFLAAIGLAIVTVIAGQVETKRLFVNRLSSAFGDALAEAGATPKDTTRLFNWMSQLHLRVNRHVSTAVVNQRIRSRSSAE